MADDAITRLRMRADLATKLWGRTFSGLTCMTFREKGEPALHRLWFLVLSGHQVERYREGLQKLGIAGDPPAVAAAKYHYFTNLIGGLSMEYVEESPKKVWIRYTAPMWTYDGVALLALPANLRRTIFSAWHPQNGRLMGCPRLGYVGTKFIMEGDPYDEGYFMEYDHDLAPSEVMRYETVTRTPEFDPAKAPRLDPAAWPEARVLKARRNFSGGYVRATVEMLMGMYGLHATCHIAALAMRCLAVQYVHAFRSALGIEGRGAADVAALFAGLLDACGQDFVRERIDDRRHRIVLGSFLPLAPDAPEAIRGAWFAFQEGAARVVNGRLRVSRRIEGVGGAADHEVWEIEDTGRWLH